MSAAPPWQAWMILVICLLALILTLGITKARAWAPSSAGVTWAMKVNVALPPDQVSALGGQQAVNSLQNDIASKIKLHGATLDVTPQASKEDGGASFSMSITGTGNLQQFKQVVFDDLTPIGGLLGGPISLTLIGDVSGGEKLPLMLESNLSTGYRWYIAQMDQQSLSQLGDPQYQSTSNLLGAPAHQTFNVQATKATGARMTLVYRRSWEKDATPTREITIQANRLSALTDLSNPAKPQQRVNDTDAIAQSPIVASAAAVPSTFDWRSTGKVTPVRDQGACGACWAFGTVAVLESHLLIRQDVSADFSEQYLLSCNHDGWTCDGGWWAHDYHIDEYYSPDTQAGAVLESDFPYVANQVACKAPYSHPYRLTNWAYVGDGNSVPSTDALKQAIYTYGPVAVSVCEGPAFNDYTGGVFNTDETSVCNGGINHSLTLVGWNDYQHYWIAKNSWGPYWGENGYIRIRWNTSNVGYAATFVQNTMPLTHDDIDGATVVDSIPYTTTADTTDASIAQDDPSFTCLEGSLDNSVWYRYIPSESGPLTVSTQGSNYDTVMSIWTGTRGNLQSVGCNDDITDTAETRYSQIQLQVTGGITYYIEVASYTSGGGTLSLSASMAAPSDPTTPTVANGLMLSRTTDISLAWSTNATWCDVHVWGGDIDIDPSGSCSTLHLGQQYGGSYQWQVTAHNAFGTATGPVWQFNVQPYAPTGLSTSAVGQSSSDPPTQTVPLPVQTQPYQISSTTTSSSSVQGVTNTLTVLTWTPSNDAPTHIDGYNVYFADGTYITTTDGSTNSYSTNDLDCGTSYGFYVTAVRQGVESAPSNLAYATPTCSPVSVLSVWTTSDDGNTKTRFYPGDSISFWGNVYNATGLSQTATLTWTVTGPCGVLTFWNGDLDIASGQTNWILSRALPSSTCSGNYVYQLSMVYDGLTSSQSSTFTTYTHIFIPVLMKP